ncbi:hypothetical protein Zm00014a_040021 [Zea mays]|uniref:Uncharacterized protein n=1 Tax=Zea mays TaxID=4577 RepID=A0A3L6DKU3_MAIZE|nr:hypothetical protein Zm00014a_040021 [Zea mays]
MEGASAALKNGARAMERRVELRQPMEEEGALGREWSSGAAHGCRWAPVMEFRSPAGSREGVVQGVSLQPGSSCSCGKGQREEDAMEGGEQSCWLLMAGEQEEDGWGNGSQGELTTMENHRAERSSPTPGERRHGETRACREGHHDLLPCARWSLGKGDAMAATEGIGQALPHSCAQLVSM